MDTEFGSKLNMSNNTEHNFTGLEALHFDFTMKPVLLLKLLWQLQHRLDCQSFKFQQAVGKEVFH